MSRRIVFSTLEQWNIFIWWSGSQRQLAQRAPRLLVTTYLYGGTFMMIMMMPGSGRSAAQFHSSEEAAHLQG